MEELTLVKQEVRKLQEQDLISKTNTFVLNKKIEKLFLCTQKIPSRCWFDGDSDTALRAAEHVRPGRSRTSTWMKVREQPTGRRERDDLCVVVVVVVVLWWHRKTGVFLPCLQPHSYSPTMLTNRRVLIGQTTDLIISNIPIGYSAEPLSRFLIGQHGFMVRVASPPAGSERS